jgi:DinB family protein
MTTEILDAPLLQHTDPSLARPLAPALVGARSDVIAAARDVLAIPEAALELPWSWIGGSEYEVRYGAYRAAEALELAEIEARVVVAAGEPRERVAARLIGPATAARWDLHGLLLPLAEPLLDADPGDEQWPVRLVVGHIISSQRAYGWGSAWWQAQGLDIADPQLPPRVPDTVWADLPDEATTEAAGTVEELRSRLDATLDLSAERLAGLADDRLAIGSRWAGFPVTIGFRLGRWSSHIREHAIQVEKTFALLRHDPTEPARLVRNLLGAYGRAEAVVFGRQGVDEAVDRIVRGAAEARDAARAARDAAGA